MPVAALPGVQLHYTDGGAGDPLLLLHGIGNSSKDWEFQIPVLTQHFRVIAPDLRGYGESSRAGPYSVEQFAADVWALLAQLGITRCRIIGHSMGGAVAMQMAVEHPERVECLVLADTLPSFRADTPAKRLLFLSRYLMMALLGPQRLASTIAAKLFPAPEHASLRARVIERNQRNDRKVYLRTIRGLIRWSVSAQLQRLAMPVFVVAAEHDYFPSEDAKAFADALPNAQLKIFANAHHSLPQEIPSEFNTALLAFFGTPATESPHESTLVTKTHR